MIRYDDVELMVCVVCGTVRAVDKEFVDRGDIYFKCVCEEGGVSTFEHLVKKKRGWAVKSRSIIKHKRQ